MELINNSVVEWSRAQFALTAMYHWIFVPLTLGLGVIMSIAETIYVRTGDESWKKLAKFWMMIFGINFAIGVATGIILEFQFGTNWSNYSWFVGDIFGAPLAIEAIVAFFMEATFISIMFFGWNKVSKKMHLASTWLTTLGATLSALWILVANAWMQHPVGMVFNPDTVRNEMSDFFAVALSPVAINKFLHTVISCWGLGAAVVVGISAWYLLKNREHDFALKSIKVASIFGFVSFLLIALTGDGSAFHVADKQPMKLAAMEGLYEGQNNAGLVAFGVLNPQKTPYKDDKDPFLFKVQIPSMLSLLTHKNFHSFVPGINDVIEGGYETPDGVALSFEEKRARGKIAVDALADYHKAKNEGTDPSEHEKTMREHYAYFGYGYLNSPEELIPNVPMTFYAFHIMVILGGYFLLFFLLIIYFQWKKQLERRRWLLHVAVWSIPLAYIASQAGWVVAEVGRQPWAIQDMLPVQVAYSSLTAGSVITTFILFFVLFTVLLIAELNILFKQIKKGPEA